MPNAPASPASGVGLKAAANADTPESIATLGGEAQAGPTRPIVPWAVGAPRRGE
jgi:hypothetical protein